MGVDDIYEEIFIRNVSRTRLTAGCVLSTNCLHCASFFSFFSELVAVSQRGQMRSGVYFVYEKEIISELN